MKGRKTLRRAGIVLAFGALLCAGMLASGALGMTLDGGTSTDSSSTATETTPPPTDSTSTDATSTEATTTDATTSSEATTSTESSTTTTTPAVFAPSISSDLGDYNPGATVTLTGSGWGPGAAVHIFVNDDEGKTWSYNTDVIADVTGGFTTQFQLPNTFVANYSVTATSASGSASTSFTDASLKIYPAPAGSGVTFTLTYQGFTNNTCTSGAGSTDTMSISNDTGGENVQTGGS